MGSNGLFILVAPGESWKLVVAPVRSRSLLLVPVAPSKRFLWLVLIHGGLWCGVVALYGSCCSWWHLVAPKSAGVIMVWRSVVRKNKVKLIVFE